MIQDNDPLVARWRAETPGCGTRVHLNNAGAGLMPAPVLETTIHHLRREASIGGYEAEDAVADAIARTYADVASVVGAASRNIAVVENATVAFAQAVSAFPLASGDSIVTTRADYISNQLLFLTIAKRFGVRIHRADDLPEGGVDPQSVRELVQRHGPRFVTVTWVPTNSGLVQDVHAVGQLCAEAGVPYIVDACQAVGQIPVDVSRLHCDYLSATARKFMRGPRGIGFLYVSDRAIARGDHPLFIDMRGARWIQADELELAPDARRFENWEFAWSLVLGMGEAARYAMSAGIERCGARSQALARYARHRLAELPGVRPLDLGRDPCAIVTAEVAGHYAPDLVRALRARGINTTPTLREYAVIDMDAKGVESALRVSPHYYNTREEIDTLVAVLGEIITPARSRVLSS